MSFGHVIVMLLFLLSFIVMMVYAFALRDLARESRAGRWVSKFGLKSFDSFISNPLFVYRLLFSKWPGMSEEFDLVSVELLRKARKLLFLNFFVFGVLFLAIVLANR